MVKRKTTLTPKSATVKKESSPIPQPPAVGEDDRFDSSDEEDLRNTIGNVPLEWYDDYDHIGYDIQGQKIGKVAGKKNEIDNFLERMEDPDYWRKVFDRQTGGEMTLTDEQVEKLRALATNRFPQIGYNPYEPFLDIFSSQKEIHPIDNRPLDKRSFVPSADERRKVSRMVHAIKMGWTLTKKAKEDKPKVYDLWATEDFEQKSKSELARLRLHCPAPKLPPPSHAESYNPPEEYLFTEAELKKWQETEPELRRIEFTPKKYECLRRVPFYENYYQERYNRCLDLFMAPRSIKKRLNVDPSALLPDLPDPRDLMPFPTILAFYMLGHKGQVRSLAIEPTVGEILVSGGEDKTVRVWYIPTGRCLKVFEMDAPVTCVAFNPNPDRTLVAVACESTTLTILNTECGDKLKNSATKDFLAGLVLGNGHSAATSDIKWSRNKKGWIQLEMNDKIKQVVWHRKGDYFSTLGFDYTNSAVFFHQLSSCGSQRPFSKKKGHVQAIAFHPSQPHFFMATREAIRIYDLSKCTLIKKLATGTRWLSCMQLEARGDNVFVGGLDRVFSWIDMDFSTKPWKTLKHHQSAIRSLCHHAKYPLLATVSDDGSAVIYHARVPPDGFTDNELVPVKRLFAHNRVEKADASAANGTTDASTTAKKVKPSLTILSSIWHTTQPWLLTGGADGSIALFSY